MYYLRTLRQLRTMIPIAPDARTCAVPIHPGVCLFVFFAKKKTLKKKVGAVVVGLDTSFGFRQMCVASSYIQKGAHFLGTNPDVADRVGNLLMPGTGPILASIQTASGVRESESLRACAPYIHTGTRRTLPFSTPPSCGTDSLYDLMLPLHHPAHCERQCTIMSW